MTKLPQADAAFEQSHVLDVQGYIAAAHFIPSSRMCAE